MSDHALEVITDALGGGPLARWAVDGSRPWWYTPAPRDAAGWAARAGEVAASAPRGWLDAVDGAFGPSTGSEAHRRLSRAAAAGGVVVTTGQQPGLFGGPIYTWSKALSARAFADAHEAATGIPTAPVFWAATDDADLAEASATWVALAGGARQLEMRARDLAEGTPMSAAPLGDMSAELAVLTEACGSAAHAAALDAVRSAYAAGATVGSAYVSLLRSVLEPLGIAVLDASHASVRAAGAPTIAEALRRAADIETALAERDAAIAEAGAQPQVAAVPGRTLVFAWEGGVKRRLRVDEAPAAAAAAGRAGYSPNVLLRPIVERAILPTVAYLAGPGELAYFAQVSAVSDAMRAASPLALPRWSCTIVEPHVARVLERLGLGRAALDDPHAPERALAQAAMPPALRDGLAEWRDAVDRAALSVRDAGRGIIDPRIADGALAAMRKRIDRVERRARAAVGRLETDAKRDLATARGALRPGGLRQERALNFVPLLARHGEALLERMRAAAHEHARRLLGAS